MERILQHVKPERRNKELVYNPTHPIFWQHSLHFETVEQALSLCIPYIVPLLKLSGLYRQGLQNAIAIHPLPLTVIDPELPRCFDGYRIMFLSDLHIDGNDAMIQPLCDALDGVEADLCLLGGDYRVKMHGDFRKVIDRFQEFLPHVRSKDGIVGILGNHDTWEMIRPLERLGIIMLINESFAISHENDRIWILGLDDPHFYRCDDYHKANQQIPERAFRIVLAHSTGALLRLTTEPANLYLCGHTHAGQISLPGIGPVITHSKLKGSYVYGRWTYRHIKGYTSSGVGTSGIPVRYNTRSEIAVITLKTA